MMIERTFRSIGICIFGYVRHKKISWDVNERNIGILFGNKPNSEK